MADLSPAQRSALEAYASQPRTRQRWVRGNTRRWLLKRGYLLACGTDYDLYDVTDAGLVALDTATPPKPSTEDGQAAEVGS